MEERIKGPTPNGGAYANVYYFDNYGKTCDKEKGTNGHILEYDDNDNCIFETHFIIRGKYKPINKNEEKQ